MLPIFVAFAKPEHIYNSFEKTFSEIVLASVLVNSVMINLVIVRLYKNGKYIVSLIEIVFYLIALLFLCLLTDSFFLFLTSILLLIKGLGYGYLEYKTDTRRLWYMEAATAVVALILLAVALPVVGNIYFLLVLIFATNIIYIPVVFRNVTVHFDHRLRNLNLFQIASSVMEAFIVSFLNNFDRAVEQGASYVFNLSSRVSAFIFVAGSISLFLYLNLNRIKHGFAIIQKYLLLGLCALVSMICLSRLLFADFSYLGSGFDRYVGSGLAGLVFTLSFYYLRNICTDAIRFSANISFCLISILCFQFIGVEKDAYAVILAVILVPVWLKMKVEGNYDQY